MKIGARQARAMPLSSIDHKEAIIPIAQLCVLGVVCYNDDVNVRPTVHIGGRHMLPCTVCSLQRVHQYTQGGDHPEALGKRSKK